MGLREPPRVAQPVQISHAAATADNELEQTASMWAPVPPHAILDTVQFPVAREIACGGFDLLTTAVIEAATSQNCRGENADAGDVALFAARRPPAPGHQPAGPPVEGVERPVAAGCLCMPLILIVW